ncbi:MAG: hypothetical protein IPK57_15650 [Chitinophagaceae bacterium]|nr:hypothetical protein [Chitinophagaceae bacterium]
MKKMTRKENPYLKPQWKEGDPFNAKQHLGKLGYKGGRNSPKLKLLLTIQPGHKVTCSLPFP